MKTKNGIFDESTGTESSAGFGAGTSISILTMLTGMLLSIYIGKEYTSGYIKNIITAHANKCDYILAKTIIAKRLSGGRISGVQFGGGIT